MKFEQFNKTIFQDKEIKWFDNTGVIKLDDNRRAEIKLSTSNVANNYTKYNVQIIHKENGKVTSKDFQFSDYMDQKDRIDNRKDYDGKFYAWYNEGSIDWYIARPSKRNIDKLTRAIMEYIDLYK